jgi:hypothetical protein
MSMNRSDPQGEFASDGKRDTANINDAKVIPKALSA